MKTFILLSCDKVARRFTEGGSFVEVVGRNCDGDQLRGDHPNEEVIVHRDEPRQVDHVIASETARKFREVARG